MAWFFEQNMRIAETRLMELVQRSVAEATKRICGTPKKVLLLPPDITRAHSGAGKITEQLYAILSKTADVFVMPTLGQHLPHTETQNKWMFDAIPEERILKHDWIRDVVHLGAVPADYVEAVTEGAANWAIPISVNRILFDKQWDLIINIGHVVPHEVLGFANHNKNYFIGLGGKETICASHMASACFGIENNLGRLVTPLRHCFNKAETEYLRSLPDMYIMVVTGYGENGELDLKGFYCGDDEDTYLLAAEHSREENVFIVPPLKKVVAYMQGDEFASTWVANKAIYRTRKAIANDGELVILAPGLKRFGEQPEVDKIIRSYGYSGTDQILRLWKEKKELQDLTHATAHLIHGSTEGRFAVTYAPGHLSREEMRGVNYDYLDYSKALKLYDPKKLKNGFNTLASGEEIYFIGSPSAGLWTTKDKVN
jgi:nickel-dependent lactate racemase